MRFTQFHFPLKIPPCFSEEEQEWCGGVGSWKGSARLTYTCIWSSAFALPLTSCSKESGFPPQLHFGNKINWENNHGSLA